MRYDYDLIVIGMGPARMASSAMAAEMGLKVLAIEAHKIGGECMNVGCIPSKALLRAAKIRHTYKKLSRFSLSPVEAPVPVGLFERIEEDLNYIGDKKTLKMFDKVELVLGQGKAKLVDRHTVEVGQRRASAKRIFVATGTKPYVPDVEGISDIDYLTNENVFKLEKVPESLAVVGAGAIACEMAQAFARLGSKVSIIYRGKRILRKEDPEAASLLEEVFRSEGIDICYEEELSKFSKSDGKVVVETKSGRSLVVDQVLLALGRSMNFAELGLENAGVSYSSKGIEVNKYLQTSARNIYAVGDCNGYYQFSHAAMHQAMVAIMNTMMPGPFRQDFRKFVVPLTIFTEPQISSVGASEEELKSRGVNAQTVSVRYEDYGAAIAEKVDAGFVKVFTNAWGKLYGAVVVGEGSGEMINEWGLAIQTKKRMPAILLLQHSFPSMAFLNKRIAETWMMQLMQGSGLMRLIASKMYRL